MEQENAPSPPDFTPVPVRARHDGWTPERQVAFIEALAETACVTQAAAAAGLSATAAYDLRRRPEAQAFRLAWDAALDFGVRRLEDAALSRAIHGVARPVFYHGEQIGERRYYDERLTQFILRRRNPTRFGDWRNGREGHPEAIAARACHSGIILPGGSDKFDKFRGFVRLGRRGRGRARPTRQAEPGSG